MKFEVCKSAKRHTNTRMEDVRISFYHSYQRRECGTKADRVRVTNEKA